MKNILHILGIVLLVGEAIWMFWPDDEPAPDPFEVQFEQLQKEHNPCAYKDDLSLRSRGIAQFDSNAMQLLPPFSQCIKTLDLSDNALTHFPDGALVLKRLTHLNLRDNRIESLDLTLDPPAYHRIEHLYLNENPMQELGSDITAFSHLTWLDLRDMPNLERISDDIQQLQHLKYLQVSGTPLAKSYPAVTKLRRLLPNTQVHWATPKQ